MTSTNYTDTFIAVAPDCPVDCGTEPRQSATPSVALLTFRLINDEPYAHTSDDALFAVHAARHGVPAERWPTERAEFFAKPRACLRASDLPKRYGWGVHHDADARVALYGMETPDYAAFVAGMRLTSGGAVVAVVNAMRSKR